MAQQINIEVARKVLDVVDAGLVKGVGNPEPGQMCVEAAVCFALGLPHGDDPQCVSRALRSLKIKLNDAEWSSNEARAKGLRRLAVAQLGSRDALDDIEFAKRVAELAIRKSVPQALRAAASIQKNAEHREKLLSAANRCEVEGTKAAADAANAAANADAAAYAADAAAYAADAAAEAAYAAYAAYAAANADDAANADAAAANAAYAAANAAYAAANAAYAAYAAARDKSLADFAEDVVQILISMKAPGCEFLALTEIAA
jgi:membrane protein involved in colicin uptake